MFSGGIKEAIGMKWVNKKLYSWKLLTMGFNYMKSIFTKNIT